MSQYKIALVAGSLRKDSYNRRLAAAVTKMAPPEFSFDPLRIDDLPLYNQDDDASSAAAVNRIKNQIRAADGLLFVTPEYNRSIPGVLKNAIDHASRPYGQSAWAGKPAGVLGASAGPAGTSMAQQHLRNILAYLDVPTMGQPEAFVRVDDNYFNAEGDITDARSKAFLQGWIIRYADWIRRFTGGH
ncbi:MAG: NAD(P)H-dependent oxidoreductase [Acidobacteria bacterium]|nr:NAD(P)H-dependent oxidoreductase [Acidobacteriota bacterium]